MRTGVIIEDLLANRPAAGRKGRFFHATDTGEVHLDTGSVWTSLGGGGGGGGRTLIEEQVKSTAGNFAFSGIPNTYTSLAIEGRLRSTIADFFESVSMRFNGDAASNYSWEYGRGDGTNWSAQQADAAEMWAGFVPGASAPVGSFGQYEYSILDYLDTTYQSVLTGEGGAFWVNRVVWVHSGLWKNTAALTSIDVFCVNTFAVGSRLRLYGLN